MTTPISTANPGYLDFSGLAQLRGDAAQSKNGAIEKTAEYVPNKSSMRFRWIADVEIKNPF